MKVIFLDVDGVLNCRSTKDRCNGYLGIDDDKVRRLREIVDTTGAVIVLSSTWKDGWERERKELQDELANYLDRKLKDEGLEILDKTEDAYWDRGVGILNWLDAHAVESFVIIDDLRFDYDSYEPLPDRVVETTEGADNGGLQDEHVNRAIEILSKKRQTAKYIGIDLEDYAQPSFCSFDKTYYGTEEDLTALKSVQEEELERLSIRSVELLEIEELEISGEIIWEHKNIWDCSYKMRAAGATITQALFKDGERFARCVRPSFYHLQYDADHIDYRDIGPRMWGFPGMIEVKDALYRSRLFQVEKFYDDEEEAKQDMHDFFKLDFSSFCDDIFGDG